MQVLHPDTKALLTDFLSTLQNTLTKIIGADAAEAALAAGLGDFCRDHLDCNIDEKGNVIIPVPSSETIN